MPQKKGSIPWNKGKKGVQIGWNKGKKTGPLTQNHKNKISLANKEKTKETKHYNWKGENCSYRSLHEWITNNLGTPTTCEHCKKTNLTKQQIHWANKTGKYKRNLSSWIRLCVKCHRKYDKTNKKMYLIYGKNKLRLTP